MKHIATISHRAASGNGDISGKQIACSCGFIATTSLVLCGDAERIAYEHLAYMAKHDAARQDASSIGVSGYRRRKAE